MARLFNVEVFNKTIAGKTGGPDPYYSGQEFYALLGSAEMMRFQVIIEASAVASTTVTVEFQMTNAMEEDTWMPTASGSVTTANPTKQELDTFKVEAPDMCAYGRLKVTSSQPGAAVRIIACGWSH